MAPYSRPFGAEPFGGSRSSNITDLILRRGDIAAQRALDSGAMWGGAIANIGQAVGGMLAQREEQKQLKKQEQALFALLDNPNAGPKDYFRVAGPKGLELWDGVQSAVEMEQAAKDKDVERALKNFPAVLAAFRSRSPEGKAQLYGRVADLAVRSGIFQPGDLPEQYTPELDPQIDALYEQIGPKEESFTLSPGQKRFKGGQMVAEAPAQAPTMEPRVVGRALVDPTGKVIYRDPEAAAPKEPKLVQIETVDEQGRPVTRFVTPQAGLELPKPTGAGKPATGQQRKALSFFNRGMEAEDIAAQLESGEEINPARIKYTPELLNFMQSNPNQSYIAAQRAFTEARLRKESGAAVPRKEYEDDAKTYFAQPGDSQATIQQKAKARKAVLAGIAYEAGDALREFYGEESIGMIERLKAASKRDEAAAQPPGYDALPAGAVYQAPDGTMRRKK